MSGRVLTTATALAWLAMAIPSAAQDKKGDPPPEAGKPAPSNLGNAQYPSVHADLRVTFQLKAPA